MLNLLGFAIEADAVEREDDGRHRTGATKDLEPGARGGLEDKGPQDDKDTKQGSEGDEENMKTFEGHRVGKWGLGSGVLCRWGDMV